MMIRSAIAKRLVSSNSSSSSSSSSGWSWLCQKTSSSSRSSSSLVGQCLNDDNNNNKKLEFEFDGIERTSKSSSSRWFHSASLGTGGGLPSSMRAAVFREPNQPLTIEEFHIPRPKSGEILLKTKACGVCHSDLHVMKGEIPFASPCVVGHEITGEVVEHGPATDTKTIARLPIGSRVIGAFIMPCGNCCYCSKGHDDLCEDFFAYNRAKGTLYDGETRLFLHSSGKPVYMYSMGGLAEYCVVPANGLSILPKSLPYTESAILGCAVFTAYGAMANAAEVRPGDSIAVIGIGGVGSSCLQIARAFGASDIIAVDVQDEKLQKAKIFGATHAINAG
ncbi:hypothetical protein GBA52_015076 [Prunus armeniaca]|nr:hypothetical protein GBA52_015076 [Prunus armeniaca]